MVSVLNELTVYWERRTRKQETVMPSAKCHARHTSTDERHLIHPEVGLRAEPKRISRSQADYE